MILILTRKDGNVTAIGWHYVILIVNECCLKGKISLLLKEINFIIKGKCVIFSQNYFSVFVQKDVLLNEADFTVDAKGRILLSCKFELKKILFHLMGYGKNHLKGKILLTQNYLNRQKDRKFRSKNTFLSKKSIGRSRPKGRIN